MQTSGAKVLAHRGHPTAGADVGGILLAPRVGRGYTMDMCKWSHRWCWIFVDGSDKALGLNMGYKSSGFKFLIVKTGKARSLTSSPSWMARMATTSIIGDLDSSSIYFATALGTQEWLKSRLASGNMPCAIETRCEWIAKLLFPKRENNSSSTPSIKTSSLPIGHIGGVTWLVAGPASRDENVENGVGSSSTRRSIGSISESEKSFETRCDNRRASSFSFCASVW